MASIARDPGGQRRILFVGPDGRRMTVRLGKVSQRDAEAVKLRVEQLLVAKLTGNAVAADTARWIAELGERLAGKLARVGLIAKPDATAKIVSLSAFLTSYVAGRTDLKPLTIRHLNDAQRHLVAFFGDGKALADISPGDADDFRRNLATRLGDNTVRRMCGRAKQFFRAALRKRLISENPFADMKGCVVQANRARDYFVTRSEAEKVLASCPDAQWRLLFSLSRFGGLRCPSEHLALRWGDVDWANGKLTVRSPKTEHHPGGESRVIPLFPELRRYLDEVWQETADGEEFVISRYRGANANLRTQLERIIRRSGLKPWPKLFHNLRATRQTELAESCPMHVVTAWIGNSAAVAAKHYLQVTDEHFRLAQEPEKAAQNPAQQARALSGEHSQNAQPAQQKTPALPGFAASCDVVQSCSVPPQGLEP